MVWFHTDRSECLLLIRLYHFYSTTHSAFPPPPTNITAQSLTDSPLRAATRRATIMRARKLANLQVHSVHSAIYPTQ